MISMSQVCIIHSYPLKKIVELLHLLEVKIEQRMLYFHWGNLTTLGGEILPPQKIGHSCTFPLITPEDGFICPFVF